MPINSMKGIFMGLSASQARLLSVTARLTDNEYHSQQIANAKMRLAAKGTEARQEYQNALSSKVLVYNSFDTYGNSVTTPFTPNVIYMYQPMKNQYALVNNSDQILVSHTDAKNFEETNTLGEFLERYGVLEKATAVDENSDEPEKMKYTLSDREKAQWYTNLWHRMNGMKESGRIQTKDGIRTTEPSNDVDEWFREFVLKLDNVVKDSFEKHYAELDSNLASSTTWLEDVLSQGIVVMQRVNSHNTDPKNKYSWDEIIYTDASELTIETDDAAIARAEVRYEEKMHEIEIKDKRYQLEINKLDSEHNALQTQVDSIRSEISKNIDRSYKTFG